MATEEDQPEMIDGDWIYMNSNMFFKKHEDGSRQFMLIFPAQALEESE